MKKKRRGHKSSGDLAKTKCDNNGLWLHKTAVEAQCNVKATKQAAIRGLNRRKEQITMKHDV
jgi:hypothetical protein